MLRRMERTMRTIASAPRRSRMNGVMSVPPLPRAEAGATRAGSPVSSIVGRLLSAADFALGFLTAASAGVWAGWAVAAGWPSAAVAAAVGEGLTLAGLTSAGLAVAAGLTWAGAAA